MDIDKSLSTLAQQQYGLLTRQQLLESELTEAAIRHRVKHGLLERVRKNVFRIAGSAKSWEQDLLAACLWAGGGAAASHRSAAALWRLPDFKTGPLDLSTSRNIKADGLLIYRTQTLSEDDVCEIAGIPTTSICRTLIDLAAVAHYKRVEDAVDDAIRRKITSLGELKSNLAVCEYQRRNGTRAFRRVLETTDPRIVHTHSNFESRLLRVLRKARLPKPVPQFVIKHEGEFIAQVDFAYPGAKLAIEAESYRWHSGTRTFNRDIDRYNRLEALGWRVIRVTWHQLMHEPNKVIALVRHHLETSAPRLAL
jgi:very-short-patch-repair endonuclease